jgi:hypothetical protein
MSHFAKIGVDESNNSIVIDVIVADRNFINTLSGTWIETSKSAKFRKMYAGIGCLYSSEEDVFYYQQPYASWTLDSNFDWQPPITRPSDDVSNGGSKHHLWDEELYQSDNTKGWVL